MSEPTRWTGIVSFQGWPIEGEDVAQRLRSAVETHPSLSFRTEGVRVFEGEPGRATLLIGKATGVVRIFEDAGEAAARMEALNRDPWLEPGKPDPDAPYRVETWNVEPAKATEPKRPERRGLPNDPNVDFLLREAEEERRCAQRCRK